MSPEEIYCLSDQSFLQLKRKTSAKLLTLLEQTHKAIESGLVQSKICLYHKGIQWKSVKISQGENYKGLPYFILDYPRYFSQEDILALRTMIWWGNEASVTLHLQGRYLKQNSNYISTKLQDFKMADAYICLNDTPWEYTFHADNYLPITQITQEQYKHYLSRQFLKISIKIPFEKIDEISKHAHEFSCLVFNCKN